jgi:hypothetical protein
MAIYSAVRLSQSQPGTGFATVYTAPASTKTIVKEIVACNTTASPITFDLALVPNGGTAGPTNQIIFGHIIPANTTVSYTYSQVLATGAFISAKASAATSLTVTVSGVEIT